MFLTSDEIAQLTGRVQAAAQVRWLKKEIWVFTVDSDGRPVIARAYAERMLGAVIKPKRRGPRLDGLAAA